MMIDRAQAAPAGEAPNGDGPAKKPAHDRDRYSNGRYGKSGIHAHHGPSHGGKRRV